MKKLFISMVLAITLMYTQAQTVKFATNTPVAGQKLAFEYDASGGNLAGKSNVVCIVFTFINSKEKISPILLTKEGNVYKGSFTPVDSTAIGIFIFSAGLTIDKNPNGYYTLFYKEGKPTGMAYYWESQFYNGFGNEIAGVKTDKIKAKVALENAFKADVLLKEKYYNDYLVLECDIDKVKGTALINEQIAILNALSDKKEADFVKISSFYGILKKKKAVDSVNNFIKTKYPKGNYAFSVYTNTIYREKNARKKALKLDSLVKNFNLDLTKPADVNKIIGLYSSIATAYGLAKNNVKFEEFSSKIEDKRNLANLYNTYAKAGAEQKDNLNFSVKISKKSLELLDTLKKELMLKKYDLKADYISSLISININYATYLDTYAILLAHLGKNKEALKYQEEAVKLNSFNNPEMNGRYVSILKKNDKDDLVVTYAERFIKDGQGTDQMKLDLKAAYKGETAFEVYYAALEKVAFAKENEKWLKEMINIPAPKFTLANLKGEIVDLASLKGKVVIVDYWATWCGPCIASFPGMQKAVDKYKTDPDVVFLFINTWQTEENREKVVKDYLTSTPYTFNVLLDTKNKQDSSKFDVIEQYKVDGIPTKFIINGEGNIKFKKVGFSGTANATVKELDMMIALAKSTK